MPLSPQRIAPIEAMDATAHDPLDMEGRSLDWAAMPAPFKNWPPGVPAVTLPRPAAWPELSCGRAMAGESPPFQTPSAADVSALLQLSCGVTASVRRAVDEYYLRANASAGALYPCELYLAAQGVDGLPDGLFHFAPERHALRAVRSGRVLAAPGLCAWLTVIFFRSSWKYRERALRYLYLDAGHLLENLDCAARSLNMSCAVDPRPDAESDADLLCLDGGRERCLMRVAFWGEASLATSLPPPVHPDLARASTVSPREKTYPLLQNVLKQPSTPAGSLPIQAAASLDMPFAQAAIARRSRRAYARQPLPEETLSILTQVLRGPAGEDAGLGVHMLVQDGHGRMASHTILDRATGTLLGQKAAPTPDALADACLGQAWMAKAGMIVCFTADLAAAEAAHGPGALGLLLVQAGRLGQRIYLAAEALSTDAKRLGACGVGAFFDVQAARLLGLGPSKRLLYVVAFGFTAGR